MAVRQEFNNIESSAVVHKLELAIKFAFYNLLSGLGFVEPNVVEESLIGSKVGNLKFNFLTTNSRQHINVFVVCFP